MVIMLKNRISEQIFGIVSFIIAVVFVVILGSFSVKDLTESKKAEETLKELTDLRIALEKYYQISGQYPDISKVEVTNNLKLLDYINESGEKISFAEIYGRNSIAFTPSTDTLEKKNKVIDTNKFEPTKEYGGWNYDYSGGTGEIHANLPYNVYSQGINWSEY